MPYSDRKRQNEFQRQAAKEKRDLFLKDKLCYACGCTNNLEIDHRDPSQKISHSVWSWSDDRRQLELDKCEVMCHTCHKLKTLLFDLPLALHGTGSGYRAGCRCDLCKEAQRERISKQRAGKEVLARFHKP